MKKGKFYKPKSCQNLHLKESVYMLYDVEKIDGSFKNIKIGLVKAILIDRVIFEKLLEFPTDNEENIYKCFQEISFDEARKEIDNTEILLSRTVFRR